MPITHAHVVKSIPQPGDLPVVIPSVDRIIFEDLPRLERMVRSLPGGQSQELRVEFERLKDQLILCLT